jgi:predicted HD phosphohydrolase
VNGEDPEAVAQVVQLAMDFRHRFQTDIFIDMYGYRRLGHNETDEPAFTQPLLYRAIADQMYYYAHHLGGDRHARDRFKDHPYYADAVAFCENYDQNCFDPDYDNLPLEFFEPMLQRVLSEVRMDDGEQAARYGA